MSRVCVCVCVCVCVRSTCMHCFALFVCLTLLASFFLPSHLSFKNMHMSVHVFAVVYRMPGIQHYTITAQHTCLNLPSCRVASSSPESTAHNFGHGETSNKATYTCTMYHAYTPTPMSIYMYDYCGEPHCMRASSVHVLMSCLGDTLHSRQSALPLSYMYMYECMNV